MLHPVVKFTRACIICRIPSLYLPILRREFDFNECFSLLSVDAFFEFFRQVLIVYRYVRFQQNVNRIKQNDILIGCKAKCPMSTLSA